MHSHNVLGMLFVLSYAPLSLVFTFLFYLQRKTQHVSRRVPFLVYLTNLGGLAFVFLNSLEFLLNPGDIFTSFLPCQLLLWSRLLLFPTYGIPYILRAWVFWYHYNLSRQRASLTPLVSTEWLFQHKFLISHKFLLYAYGLGLLLHCIPPLLLETLRPPSFLMNTNNCAGSDSLAYIMGVMSAVYVLATCTLAFFLRTSEDALNIKEELRWCCISWSAGIVVWGLLGLIPGTYHLRETFPAMIFVFLSMGVCFCISTVWVWIQARKERKIRRDTSAELTRRVTLENILWNPSLRNAFRRYLCLQLCVENLLFWEDVQEWKKSPEHAWSEAQRICREYIVDGSLHEVNISDKMKTSVREFFKSAPSAESEYTVLSIFDTALKEVENLMNENSYYPFLRHPIYKEYCKHNNV